MDRKETAIDLFSKQKFHCSQAVLASFCDVLGIDKLEALKLSACFGGGMRKGEMCGCITGGLMVLGLLYGSIDDKKKADKKGLEFINRFKEKNESYLCRELLKKSFAIKEEAEEIKKEQLTARKCPEYVTSAVEILEEMINEGN